MSKGRGRASRRRLRGPARALERRRENVDILLGVLGFFVLALFVSTAVAEVRGEPALARAVVLAVLVGLGYALIRLRRILKARLERMLAGDADLAGPGHEAPFSRRSASR